MTDTTRETAGVTPVVDERPPWVALFGDDAPDALASPFEVARRRRRLLGMSMLLIVPVGLFALGVMINVVVVQVASNLYEQKDWTASAAWSRASVSLNPIDQFLPHYNLGTAYAKGGLLDDARKELTTAVKNAPTPEAQCPARANLALTYEKLGDRAAKNGDSNDAQKQYLTAAVLWQQTTQDRCFQSQQFSDKADSATDRLQKKLQEQQQNQQQNQDGQQGQQGDQQQGGSDGQQGGTGDQQGGQQGGTGDQQGGTGDQQGGQQGGTGDQQGGQQGGTGDQQGGTGDQQGGQQGGTGDQQGGSGSTSDGGQPGEGPADQSKTLGEKLGALQSRDEQSSRARDQGDRGATGGASKPW